MSASALVDLATPVVADGRVYSVAPNGLATAFDLESGDVIWSVSIEELADDPLPGVGGGIVVSPMGVVAHAGGRVGSTEEDEGTTEETYEETADGTAID